MLEPIFRHPWLWTLAALVPLILFPQIDIATSALFFEPERHIFVLRTHPLGEFVRKTLPIILFVLAGGVAPAGGGGPVARPCHRQGHPPHRRLRGGGAGAGAGAGDQHPAQG